MKQGTWVIFGVASLAFGLAGQMACSPVGARGGDQCAADDPDCANSSGKGGSGQTSGGKGGGIIFSGSGGSGNSGPVIDNCGTDPNVDDDGDGATENQGDCKDCDPNVGPGAIEVLTDPNDPMAKKSDEDCDGLIDNVATYCDDNLALADTDPNNGARAVDICQFTNGNSLKPGVVNAMYVRASGAPLAAPGAQIGLLDGFGPNVKVQGGARMLAVSSGRARLPTDADACGQMSCPGTGIGAPPPGFPQDPPGCPISQFIADDVGLEVHLRAPTNATGYKFNFKFYTFEYPEYVCDDYNDQFISLVNPAPAGSIKGNISFDVKTNPVSVNIAFFDVCDPDPIHPCALGPNQMFGTGFNEWNDAGGTGWLESQAPIKGGQEFIIRWTIWDTGDGLLDSTALVDNFQWIANGGTVVVGTAPVPVPK